jgi:hypothetical protein
VDVGILVAREAWDGNGSTESLVGVAGGVDRRIWRALTVRAEGTALRVWQESDDAWLAGGTVGTRWRWGEGRWRPMLDVAVGVSQSTKAVPPGGTRFNYLALIGAGAERRVGPINLGVTGRWTHVSNNGREGRHRNPDIQSLGALVSVGWEH